MQSDRCGTWDCMTDQQEPFLSFEVEAGASDIRETGPGTNELSFSVHDPHRGEGQEGVTTG